MIKSLLDADENPPEGTRVIIEETTIDAPRAANIDETILSDQTADREDILELSPVNTDAQTASNISETPFETVNSAAPVENFTEAPRVENNEPFPFQAAAFEPESQAETARKSGLAYAAGITLFAAVVFMMVIGWGADLLFGTSPWGIVGGIVLGALVGFIQFFRLTAQILKNKD